MLLNTGAWVALCLSHRCKQRLPHLFPGFRDIGGLGVSSPHPCSPALTSASIPSVTSTPLYKGASPGPSSFVTPYSSPRPGPAGFRYHPNFDSRLCTLSFLLTPRLISLGGCHILLSMSTHTCIPYAIPTAELLLCTAKCLPFSAILQSAL